MAPIGNKLLWIHDGDDVSGKIIELLNKLACRFLYHFCFTVINALSLVLSKKVKLLLQPVLISHVLL